MSLIVKLAPDNPMMRATAVQMESHLVELMFYREFVSSLCEAIPRYHAVEISKARDAFVLLLEDLSDGQMIEQLTLSTEEARTAIEGVAALQATYWQGSSLRKQRWLMRDGAADSKRSHPEGLAAAPGVGAFGLAGAALEASPPHSLSRTVATFRLSGDCGVAPLLSLGLEAPVGAVHWRNVLDGFVVGCGVVGGR